MPRIVDHDERRRQICDSLLELISEVGVPGATIRGLATRSGWSVGVISHYFHDRKDLLLGGLRRAAEILAEHNSRIVSTLNGLQALEQILEGSIPLDKRRLALARIFFFFYVEAMNDEALREEVESYLLGWRKSVVRAIHQAQDVGDLPSEIDAKQICADLVGLADGMSIHALMDKRVMQRLQEQSPVRFWIRSMASKA